MMQKLKREEMFWLTAETQEDVDNLYAAYKIHNVDMIPSHEIWTDRIYRLVYILDTGVNTNLYDLFSKACSRKVTGSGDIIEFDVLVEEQAPGSVTLRATSVKGFNVFSVGWGNYGRSWRLKSI